MESRFLKNVVPRYFGSLAHNKVHQEVTHFAMAGCVINCVHTSIVRRTTWVGLK